jgi:hypothetical protein
MVLVRPAAVKARIERDAAEKARRGVISNPIIPVLSAMCVIG